MFVIKRVTDGKYVADQRKRAGKSYTTNLKYVKLFATAEEAARDLCPGNEIVISARTHNSI